MNTEKCFSKGEVIFKQGEEGNCLYQILEGSVEVIANYGKEDEFSLTVLGPGKIFGEMAVVECFPRSSTVVAKEDIKVIEISREELMSFFKERPEMIFKIMKQLGIRLKQLTDDYNDVTNAVKEAKAASAPAGAAFLSKIKKFLTFYSVAKGNIDKPSVESLREVSAKLSTDRPSNLETYEAGTIIFKKGEFARCMYAVYGGSVGIYSDYGTDNQNRLTELFPVSFFGEMGMVADETRSATAVAEADDTYVEIIRPEDLEDLMSESPVKVEMIIKHLSHRLRTLTYDYLTACKEVTELYNKDLL